MEEKKEEIKIVKKDEEKEKENVEEVKTIQKKRK